MFYPDRNADQVFRKIGSEFHFRRNGGVRHAPGMFDQGFDTAERLCQRNDSKSVEETMHLRDTSPDAEGKRSAETGHLLLSTLHTIGAANTIDRIIDVFPPSQQRQIAIQLSTVLNAVVSQQLLPTVDGGMVPAFEIMTVTPAIRNMIRDNKVPQIDGLLYSSNREDMVSMDASILALCQKGVISKDTALIYATNPELLRKKLV